jgi:hypothetical protein
MLLPIRRLGAIGQFFDKTDNLAVLSFYFLPALAAKADPVIEEFKNIPGEFVITAIEIFLKICTQIQQAMLEMLQDLSPLLPPRTIKTDEVIIPVTILLKILSLTAHPGSRLQVISTA